MRKILVEEQITACGSVLGGSSIGRNRWMISSSDFKPGKVPPGGRYLDDAVATARRFCQTACSSGPVLLLVVNLDRRVLRAWSYQIHEEELDPDDFQV